MIHPLQTGGVVILLFQQPPSFWLAFLEDGVQPFLNVFTGQSLIFAWMSVGIGVCWETNATQTHFNMPTFIHNEKQKRAINLDFIDSITKEDVNGFESGFEIIFERVPANGTAEGLAEVGRWRFETEKERDKVLKWILNSYGLGV